MNHNLQEEMRRLHKENLEYLEKKRKAQTEYRILERVSWISGIVLFLSVLALDSDSWIPVIIALFASFVLFMSLLFTEKLNF